MGKKMLRVCIICFKIRKDIGSGIPRYTFELVRNLKRIHDHLDIVVVEYGESPSNVLLRILRRMALVIKLYPIKADIYHAVSPQLSVPLLLARKKPIIITVHDLLPFAHRVYANSKFSIFKYIFDRYIFHKCDVIISIAEYWKKYLVHYFEVPKDKIMVIPVGVDLEFFKPSRKITRSSERIVLYVGGLTREKGLELLLRAFKKVAIKMKKVRLLIGGKGPDEHYFKELVKQLSIEKYVNFLGFIPEEKLPLYYSIADVFVWPSHVGFALMLLEAMACGTSIISVRKLEIPEYVGNVAILVEPGNADQLADAILQVLYDDNLRRSLSEKGLKRISNFSWEKCALNTLQVYEKLLEDLR